MALLNVTSPHAHTKQDTGRVMQWVLLCTLPGLATLTYFFGWGTFTNVMIAAVVAVISEALVLRLRKRPIGFYLKDCSALVTATLLALALPPLAPWWVVVVGTSFAIIIAKQLYGGLGYNPFNPAMVGYVVLLISFPVQMTTWATPQPLLSPDVAHLGLMEALHIVFGTGDSASTTLLIDAYTAATPLDTLKHNSGLMLSQLYEQTPLFSQAQIAGVGWEWVNVAFLAGGCVLLYLRVFTWHAPVAMLTSLGLCAAIFYDGGSSASHGSPFFHLFSGGTMLGAFFIITDPVSSATSNKGRLVFGALIGIVIFIIRSWGNYPDAVAFAVLLMNFAAPLIDNYTLPRTYGHKKPRRATEKKD